MYSIDARNYEKNIFPFRVCPARPVNLEGNERLLSLRDRPMPSSLVWFSALLNNVLPSTFRPIISFNTFALKTPSSPA